MNAKSHVTGPGNLKFGQTATPSEFAQQMTKMALTPNTSFEDNVPVLSGEEISGDAKTDWSLSGTCNQDFDRESFEMWAYANRLKDMPFVFTPNRDHDVAWSGTATIVPIGVGGDVKKKNTSDFEFRVVGEPIPIDEDGNPITLT